MLSISPCVTQSVGNEALKIGSKHKPCASEKPLGSLSDRVSTKQSSCHSQTWTWATNQLAAHFRFLAVLAVAVTLSSIPLLQHAYRLRVASSLPKVAARELSCGAWAPWRHFPDKSRPQYTYDELYLHASLSNTCPAPVQKPTIGILQVCTNAPKSWYLDFVIHNHRDYAKRWGYEYSMYPGRMDQTYWAKIVALRDKVLDELRKPKPEDRLEWIL